MQTTREIEQPGLIANVTVGRALTHPAASSHTAGIREGNRVRPAEQKRGLVELDALNARGTAVDGDQSQTAQPDRPAQPQPVARLAPHRCHRCPRRG